MKQIPLDQIGYDPQYYPRVNGKEDWFTVNIYREALLSHPEKADARNKDAFPPVVVVRHATDDYKWLLLDGLHRVRAFTRAGLERIYAVEERIPKSRWLARSVELNVSAKRGLDTGDKRWIAKRLEIEGWKPGAVAELLQMPLGSFERLTATRIEPLSMTAAKKIPEGRGNRKVNGEHYGFLKSPLAAASGTANARAALMAQGSMASHDVVDILDSMIAVCEAKCLDMTDEIVAKKVEYLKSLLESF